MRYLAPVAFGPLLCAFAQPEPPPNAPRHAFADGSEARLRYLVDALDSNPEGLTNTAISNAFRELLWLHGERGLEAVGGSISRTRPFYRSVITPQAMRSPALPAGSVL